MKRIVLCLTAVFTCLMGFSQEHVENVNKMYHSQVAAPRSEIIIPRVNGYTVYKCDFHTHTVFSDGNVWPAYRVKEAWLDGLDVMAMTDHIEYRPFASYFNADFNTSYDIAAAEAKKYNMLLIRGTEITRQQGPIGHFNALFTTDNNTIPDDDPKVSIQNALNQGAYILFNHPGWVVDTVVISDFQKELMDAHMIHGIEVINSHEYYPRVLSWCIDGNYTVFANTDIHGISSEDFAVHRPMTLVLATQLTAESIREALDNGRTLAYWANQLAGQASLLEGLFRASVLFTPYDAQRSTVTNKSSLPFTFEIAGTSYTLPALSTIVCKTPPASTIKVTNMWCYEDRHPEFNL